MSPWRGFPNSIFPISSLASRDLDRVLVSNFESTFRTEFVPESNLFDDLDLSVGSNLEKTSRIEILPDSNPFDDSLVGAE